MVVRFTYRGQRDIPLGATHVFIAIDNIPAWAFNRHPNLVEVICSEDVGKIEQHAFCNCPRLRKVVMRGVLVVEEYAFGGCPLTDVECDKLEIIGFGAFSHCPSLSSIDLSSARIVEGGAFEACEALTSAIFSDKLERIGGFAFHNCTSLERITIPLKLGILTDLNFHHLVRLM